MPHYVGQQNDTTLPKNQPELSILVCVLNEQDAIALFLDRLIPVIKSATQSYEIVFVNDGSTDQTLNILYEKCSVKDNHIRIINLSRNFGKDIAMTAGLDHVKGQAVIPMDVDLQDPPELIIDMLKLWKKGADTVIAIRSDRNNDSFIKQKTAVVFYKLIQKMSSIKIPQNAGDFRLIDQKLLNVIRRMPERSRFMKGIFSFPGFKSEHVYYSRPPRSTGRSKWGFWKLWNFALDGIFNFSTVPLRIWTYMGVLLALLSTSYAVYIFFKTMILGVDVPGYASLICAILFSSAINLIGLGIIGEYIGRIFEEVKNRPLYVIESLYEYEDCLPDPPERPALQAPHD
ncbi:MAG: glycosyltransferase family 2 protein [Parahaliea sp.]